MKSIIQSIIATNESETLNKFINMLPWLYSILNNCRNAKLAVIVRYELGLSKYPNL